MSVATFQGNYVFTKTDSKATGHSPCSEDGSLRLLCQDLAVGRWQENSKQCFYFLSAWPPRNFADLSHRASQRNKKGSFSVSFLSEQLWFDSECFVFVFVLSLRAKNSQHSMVLSSEELENI